MRHSMYRLALVVVLFVCGDSVNGQTLTVTGPCPGTMTFTVTGATPVVRIYYLWAFGPGSHVIPPGNLCSGTTLGLNNTVQVATWTASNNAGTAVVTWPVPPAACGSVWTQVLDGATCNTTNVVPL